MPYIDRTFTSPPVSRGTNRVNSQGQAPAFVKDKASFRYANILLAGQTLVIPCYGSQFYFLTATAPIFARPSGGIFSEYGTGQGMQLDESNAFNLLEVKNAQSFAVVFEVFVGFQGFIDNRLIIANTSSPQVAYPTYSTPNSATSIAITDRSGTKITDINGNNWYALFRIAIVISNTDTGVVLLLQKAGSLVANGPAIAAIQPATEIRLDVSGNYSLNNGGANINAIVSEIYSVIAAV